MHEIKAIIRPDRLDRVLDELRQITDVPGITVSAVTGFGKRQPPPAGESLEFGRVTMTKLELVVPDAMLSQALAGIRRGWQGVRPCRRTGDEDPVERGGDRCPLISPEGRWRS